MDKELAAAALQKLIGVNKVEARSAAPMPSKASAFL
jgi:hypothetical protein